MPKKPKSEMSAVAERLANDVANYIELGDLAGAVQVLRNGLEATKRVRGTVAGSTKRYEDVPDHTTRILSARLLIEFGSGKAIQRIHQQIDDGRERQIAPREIFARLAGEGRQMISIMQSYIEAADAMQTKKAEQVIDLPTLTEMEEKATH